MAVRDIYANSDLQNGKLADAVAVSGNKTVTIVSTMETLATDSANSVYRFFVGLNPCLIPVDIQVYNDDLNSSTGDDFDLGIYEGNGGAVIDKDYLVDGITFATARGKAAPLDGMTTVDIANLGKKLYEHAGHTIKTKKDSYDIALTCNTAANTAGTITLVGTFVQG